MFATRSRATPVKPRRPAKRPQKPDPWELAGGEKPQEQGPWLLSYLDVMTLLFSFFVMLFAYEKAMNANLVKQAAANQAATATVHSAQVAAPPATTASPPTEAAINAMKDQAKVYEVARAVANHPTPDETQRRERTMQLQPALDALAHIGHSVVPEAMASEQVAAQLSTVLKDETARRQIEIQRSAEAVRMEVNESILFDSASASLRSEGIALLQRLAPILAQQEGTISIEGHTDPSPISTAQFPSNWELSAARASAVTRFLVNKGLPAERLRAVGMADTHPRDSNASPEGRARNRRVSVVVFTQPTAG
jgi:chemotaxis protein MotB